MRRIVTLVLVAVVTAVGCTSGSGDSTTPAASTRRHPGAAVTEARAARTVPDAFFGFNAASIVQTVNVDLLLDPKLQDELATFPTRLLRVPTGTAAQWLDWRTGRFIQNPDSLFASIPADRRPVTMDDWAGLLHRSGAEGVWDLNVLTSSLDDQVAMLEEAEKLGLGVHYIELGNELWDARSIYPKVYPSGKAYAETMNTWIPTLRRRFPDARIAVAGADPSDPLFSSAFGERYRNWNREVLATIHDADAITIHPYWTLPDGAAPGSSVEATLTAGLDAWDDVVAETLADVPDGMALWATEWNQAAWGAGDGTQIWAQALSVVAVGMEQLTDDRIGMSLVHDIVDGVENPHDAGISVTFPAFTDGAHGSGKMVRTGLGEALPLLFGAVPPGSTVRALAVPAGGKVGSHGAVRGVLVEGVDPRAVFVNLTGKPTRIDLDGTLGGAWRATSMSAPPDSTPGWVADDTVTTRTKDATGSVTLPGWSVTRLARPGPVTQR